MNDSLVAPKHRVRALGSVLKTFFWRTASRFALHGLCPWELEDDWLHFEQRDMVLPSAGEGFDGSRIVHLSDIHCSPLMRPRHILNYIEVVNRLEPDFVVLTGDFITASARCYARQAGELLRQLSPRVGSLAVLGNHDYGVWVPDTHRGSESLGEYLREQLEGAGVRTLVNQSVSYVTDGGKITFVGLGEFWTPIYDAARAFAGPSNRGATVALVHNPDAAPELDRLGADYVLAGHTHGKATADTAIHNALFPVVHRHFVAGEHDLRCGGRLYVNRGLGPSRRVHASQKPEIALFTVRSGRRVAGQKSGPARPGTRKQPRQTGTS